MSAAGPAAAGSDATTIAVGDADAALFASDLHLDDDQPALTARFLARLDARLAADRAGRAARPGAEPPALFLLGDLFEFWIGDDAPGEAGEALAAQLAARAADGLRVHLMHGNRDFLIDVPTAAALSPAAAAPPYSARCGATLLADPTVVTIGGRRVLLAHGDALCTDDTRYQQWRALCRSPAWQQAALARPLAERRALALSLRRQSREGREGREGSRGREGLERGSGQASLDSAGDVARHAVDALMAAHACDLLVHGHTHRPALHRWTAGGRERLRWVLPDWSADPAAPRGDVRSLAEALAGFT